MPPFTINVVNEHFHSSNEYEIATAETARVEALQSALQIGTSEVIGGKHFFAAEVTVTKGNETVCRFVVSIGASPLMISE